MTVGVRLWSRAEVVSRVLTLGSKGVIVVAPRMVARSAVLSSLGIAPVPHPMGVGEYVAAGPMGLTDVPGVYVAGNVTDLMAQVVTAAAAGSAAGAAIHGDLINEETRQAVLRYRESAAVELRSAS